MQTTNPILNTDSYKVTHHRQYPPGMTGMYSYLEARGGSYSEIVFFGLQYYLKEYLSRRVTAEDIQEAEEFFKKHFQGAILFNRDGWEHILQKHGGKLPVSIKAIPEGSVLPSKNVLLTIESTDEACPWIANYLETLLVQVWYGTTIATNSRAMKQLLQRAALRSGTAQHLDRMLHDFGFRGVSSVETAAMGGAAHLLQFSSTDNLAGLVMARDYYQTAMAGYSQPASEHSTVTAWGRDGELKAYRHMLESYPEGSIVAVSDSYDIYAACKQYWGNELKQMVEHRNGCLIIRPDSGDPCRTLPKILSILEAGFGCRENEKGYKMLPPYVRLLQGDGIAVDTLSRIVDAILFEGYSLDNVFFGSGGGLLQRFNRDTLQIACKCSSIVVDGSSRDIYKEPITSPWKSSKRGRFKVLHTDRGYETVAESTPGEDCLREVFRNGEILIEDSLDEIRHRAAIPNPLG